MEKLKNKFMSAEAAAELIKHDEVIGSSGFTPAGHPKAVPIALAKKAEKLHAEGKPFQISLYTGASTGDELDGALARAKAIKFRLPYQSNNDVRNGINKGEIEYTDMHLSHVAQYIRYGFLPKITTALVEACDITDDGKVYLTMSGGISATSLLTADKIILELNRSCPDGLKEMHDVYIPDAPPSRLPFDITHTSQRLGKNYVQVDPSKIVAIVETNKPDASADLRPPGEMETKIAEHVVEFIQNEQRKGRMPKGLPYQSGVGNVANAVLSCFAKLPGIEPIQMYTEVLQDSIFEIIEADRLQAASTCSLTFSAKGNEKFKKQIEIFKKKVMIRQQEISNHPEIIRRLGLVGMNTALEMDIFGNVNSTHVLGSKMMNGIGGSGDFTRNAFCSIFMTQSIAKDGDISSIVPMVSHMDHSEHSVQVVVTEQGLADLRGLSPIKRAREIIKKCAHPIYQPLLTEYLEYGIKNASSRHTPQVLSRAFEFHTRFEQTGSMRR